MIRQIKLEKYIKRFTGKIYKVYSFRYIHDGYAAITDTVNKRLDILHEQVNIKPVIWHEMGHIIFDHIDASPLEDEYNAQMWALGELLKRGYTKIFEESIEWIKNDWPDTDNPTPTDEVYLIVRDKILNLIRNEGIKPND